MAKTTAKQTIKERSLMGGSTSPECQSVFSSMVVNITGTSDHDGPVSVVKMDRNIPWSGHESGANRIKLSLWKHTINVVAI